MFPHFQLHLYRIGTYNPQWPGQYLFCLHLYLRSGWMSTHLVNHILDYVQRESIYLLRTCILKDVFTTWWTRFVSTIRVQVQGLLLYLRTKTYLGIICCLLDNGYKPNCTCYSAEPRHVELGYAELPFVANSFGSSKHPN